MYVIKYKANKGIVVVVAVDTMEFYTDETKKVTWSYLPTKLQAMLLLFNKSESLECAKVVALIHCKPPNLDMKKNIAKISLGTFHKP